MNASQVQFVSSKNKEFLINFRLILECNWLMYDFKTSRSYKI